MTRVDVNAIPREHFSVTEHDGLRLIRPRKAFFDWAGVNRWWRSVVVDEEGRIVSCGFPKFGNVGEFEDDTRKLEQALADGAAVELTHKHDGTLAIRSVIRGKVVWRTRNTIDGGVYRDAIEAAADGYPFLADPRFAPTGSLLFEFVAPTNKVVVGYDKADLVMLAIVAHRGPHLLNDWEARHWAVGHELPFTERYELALTLPALVEQVQAWDHAEGIVARVGQTLVKIKSAWYLAQHRLKYSLSYERIVELAVDECIHSIVALERVMAERGADFEVIDEARDFFRGYRAHAAAAWTMLESVMRRVTSAKAALAPGDERTRKKAFAFWAKTLPDIERTLAFMAYDGRVASMVDVLARKVVR